MFTFNNFRILLSRGSSVLWPACNSITFQQICWNLLKSDWITSLGVFEWSLNFFWFCLTLSVPEKTKDLIFEMLIVTQTININNLRTTSTKSFNLHTIRELVEYSLKYFLSKINVYSHQFRNIAVPR